MTAKWEQEYTREFGEEFPHNLTFYSKEDIVEWSIAFIKKHVVESVDWPNGRHVMEELIDNSNVLSNRELSRKVRNETIVECIKCFQKAMVGNDE